MLRLVHSNEKNDNLLGSDPKDLLDLAVLYCDLPGKERVYFLGSTLSLMRQKIYLHQILTSNGLNIQARCLHVRQIRSFATIIDELPIKNARHDHKAAAAMIEFFKSNENSCFSNSDFI